MADSAEESQGRQQAPGPPAARRDQLQVSTFHNFLGLKTGLCTGRSRCPIAQY
eukprot:COSAG04_NODE_5813_length_1481_cov_1.092286_3_plen_52_part_01